MRDRWLVAACGLGMAGFAALNGVAVALYPGGTWFNRRAAGHSFAKNFLCDLMQTRALNGQPAPIGSLLARIGMVVMLIALASFYLQIAKLEQPPGRLSRVVRIAGLLTCGLGCLVPLATSDQFRELHIISVVAAFIPSLVATIAALLVWLRAPGVSRAMKAPAIITFAAGAFDGVMYAFVYASPMLGLVPASRSTRRMITATLPLFQRIAMLALMTWMVVVCIHTIRASKQPPTPALPASD